MAGRDETYVLRNSDPGATVVQQSIYETSSTAKHKLGERLILGDRVFRYAHFVATTAAGLVSAPDQSLVGSNNLLADGSCVALAADVAWDGQPAITAALAAGDTHVAVTHASALDNVTKDVLKGGYICLTDSAGVNQLYKIKQNNAWTSSGSLADIVAMELYDPILTATADATTGVQMIQSPWRNLRAAAVGTDDAVSGVPQVAMTATTACYGWVQTWGPGLVKTDTDTAFAGIDVELSGTGQVATRDTDGTEPRIGIGLADVTTADDGAIVLIQLYP